MRLLLLTGLVLLTCAFKFSNVAFLGGKVYTTGSEGGGGESTTLVTEDAITFTTEDGSTFIQE